MQAANKIEWAKLLSEAISEPGRISEAYQRFHGYSLGNRTWAMMQCMLRGITPGPIASFNRWKELGRQVKKGQKALCLCMPVTCKRKTVDQAGSETESSYQVFVLKNNWFVLSQTDGQPYAPEPLPEWDELRALETLKIKRTVFDVMNGNVQGYAAPGRRVSVSPIAVNPHKTLFHELGHVLLGHIEADTLTDTEHTPRNIMETEAESVAMLCCASLALPGIEHSRSYIQSWAAGAPISEKSAQRIFSAADKVLKAGTESLEVSDSLQDPVTRTKQRAG
jgi:antirestriction protein ArdC